MGGSDDVYSSLVAATATVVLVGVESADYADLQQALEGEGPPLGQMKAIFSKEGSVCGANTWDVEVPHTLPEGLQGV